MTVLEVKNPPAPPGSDEWRKVVSPSKIPALLGVSRFRSQYTVWHEMAGLVAPEPIAEARQDDFDYGHACELAAREYWLYKNPRVAAVPRRSRLHQRRPVVPEPRDPRPPRIARPHPQGRRGENRTR